MVTRVLVAKADDDRRNGRPHAAAPSRTSLGFQDVIAALLLILIAIVPLRDGSRPLEAQAINALAASILIIAFSGWVVLSQSPHPTPLRRYLIPAALFTSATAWVGLQLIPGLPSGVLNPVWRLASETLSVPILGRISVDPDLTSAGLLRLMTAAWVFWLASQLGNSARRGYALLAGLAVIEVALGVYGIVGLALNQVPDASLATANSVTSTYEIRNTYATYAGLGVVVCAAMTWRHFKRGLDAEAGSLRLMLSFLIRRAEGLGALWVAAVVFLSACLLLSASRGGAISTGVGLIVLAYLGSGRRRQGRERQSAILRAAIPVAAVVAVIGLALLLFGDSLFGRLSDSGLSDAGRPFVYRTTLDAILASPWFGWGYGTFVSVFPMFFDGTGDAFVSWDLAHNTYLEIWLGCGLVAGTLLIGSVVAIAVDCARGAMSRERDALLPALAAAASVLVGLHALVDFSLQYQGVALTYALVLGVGFAQARSSRAVQSDARGHISARGAVEKVAA